MIPPLTLQFYCYDVYHRHRRRHQLSRAGRRDWLIRSPVVNGVGGISSRRVGGRAGMLKSTAKDRIVLAIVAEAGLLAAAAMVSAGVPIPIKIYGGIATTAMAMGLRNAVVRKIAIPDMTTTMLTLTVTGIAAASSLAGGDNPRWQRRVGDVAPML